MKTRINSIVAPLFALSFAVVSTPSSLAQTVARLSLSTQAEVDASSAITEVAGDLVIETAADTSDPITNLDGLENLRTVGGILFIANNNGLVDTLGLLNLTDVGTLFIQSNNALDNIDGLSNLAVVENELLIASNESLTRLCGLYTLFDVQGVDWNYIVDEGSALYGPEFDEGIRERIGSPCVLEEPEKDEPIDPELWIRGLFEEGVLSKWQARSLLYSLRKNCPRIFLWKVYILTRWGILTEELAQPLRDAMANAETEKRCRSWFCYKPKRIVKKRGWRRR